MVVVVVGRVVFVAVVGGRVVAVDVGRADFPDFPPESVRSSNLAEQLRPIAVTMTMGSANSRVSRPMRRKATWPAPAGAKRFVDSSVPCHARVGVSERVEVGRMGRLLQ